MDQPKLIKLISLAGIFLLIMSCNLPSSQGGKATPTQMMQLKTSPPIQPTLPAVPQISPTLPVEQPTQTTEPDVNFNGVSFSYDKSLASGVETAVIPSSIVPDGAPFELYPEYIQFKFNGYLLQDKFFEPTIEIYPVEQYKQINEPAGDMIANLHNLIAQKPAAPEEIPHLPFGNAAQLMRAQVKYLKFQNGSGVRFLTQYAQSYVPINNHDLFYCFQGMTDNESYYISITLPVNHPSLPPTYESVPNNDWEAFSNQFSTYIKDMEQNLSTQPTNSFNPNLELLDQMVETILVNK